MLTKLKLKFIIFIILWLGAFYEILYQTATQDFLFTFLKEQPDIAPFLLIILQLIFASFILPCSPLAVFAGMLWGFKIGVVYSTLSTLISSVWCFVLSRYLYRAWFKKKISSIMILRMQKLIKSYSWQASAIAHMNPIFPGSSIGYFFGSSEITMFSYTLGAAIGNIPLQLIMVGIGHLTFNTLNQSLNLCFVLLLVIIAAIAIYKGVFKGFKNGY